MKNTTKLNEVGNLIIEDAFNDYIEFNIVGDGLISVEFYLRKKSDNSVMLHKNGAIKLVEMLKKEYSI